MGTRRLQPSTTASFFLPQERVQYGLNLRFGDRYREDYTCNRRPLTGFGVTWDTISGAGTDITVGIGGQVVGDDHLSIAFERVAGGGPEETDPVLWLNRRCVYDHRRERILPFATHHSRRVHVSPREPARHDARHLYVHRGELR